MTAKRAYDLVLVSLALIPTSILMASIALWIRLVTKQPILFKQKRTGKNGKAFSIYKFRTVIDGSSLPTPVSAATILDPNLALSKPKNKLIPGGYILRATGLDELPQLFNILRGDMSIVGPRPVTLCEAKNFPAFAHKRFEAVPGLTGLWQINGKNSTTFRRMIAFDRLYIQKQGVLIDIVITLGTIPAVVRNAFTQTA